MTHISGNSLAIFQRVDGNLLQGLPPLLVFLPLVIFHMSYVVIGTRLCPQRSVSDLHQAWTLRCWKGKGTKTLCISVVKGTLWGNCNFLLEHFKGNKAMTRGHGGNCLLHMYIADLTCKTWNIEFAESIQYTNPGAHRARKCWAPCAICCGVFSACTKRHRSC